MLISLNEWRKKMGEAAVVTGSKVTPAMQDKVKEGGAGGIWGATSGCNKSAKCNKAKKSKK